MSKTMYTKEYHEEYARLTLGFLLPYSINNFFCTDKPDIQNEADSIGIEVTWAGTQDHMKSQSYGYKYLGLIPSLKERSNFMGEFYSKEGKVYGFSPTKCLISPSDVTINGIKTAIIKKIKKCRSYSKFNEMGLYCYIDYSINDIELKDIMKLEISPFNFLMVNTMNEIYLIKNNTYKCHKITGNELARIKKQALVNIKK